MKRNKNENYKENKIRKGAASKKAKYKKQNIHNNHK